MSAAVITTPTGLSLLSLSRPPIAITSQTPLPLPSRFPSNTTPLVAVSTSTGHIFLYASGGHVIWEYDFRGRRIAEISVGGGSKITAACAVSERVLVGLTGGGLRMAEKKDGKWVWIKDIEGPAREVARMVSSTDGAHAVLHTITGDVWIWGQDSGNCLIVSERNGTYPASAALAFVAPMIPATLVLVSGPTLQFRPCSQMGKPAAGPHAITRDLRPFGAAHVDVLDLAFSPVIDSADGSKRGGLCAALGSNGRAALFGMDNLNATPKMVDISPDAVSLSFIDGATLCVATADGRLLVKDLWNLGKPAEELATSEQVASITLLPEMAKARLSRPSLGPSIASTTSSRRSVLGDARNMLNATSPVPPLPATKADKGKAAVRVMGIRPSTSEMHLAPTASSEQDLADAEVRTSTAQGYRSFSHASSSSSSRSSRTARASDTAPPPRASLPRTVSAPIQPLREVAKASSSSSSIAPRSASASVSTSSASTRPIPAAHPLRTPAPLAREVIPEEESDESAHIERPADERRRGSPGSDAAEEGTHLGWALHAEHDGGRTAIRVKEGPAALLGDNEILELRREMARLQMDLLRMNRNLKSDIRAAVAPLRKEMEAQRGVMERQQREIERLRRGY